MNIALLFQDRLFAFLGQQLQRWSGGTSSPSNVPSRVHATFRNAPELIAANASSTGATGQFVTTSHNKPLRVVRVVETGQTRNSVGRMVISGRMADVCAELDRLAAREAALT